MVDHSHGGFDVIRKQGFDIIKGENFVFENNTLNEGMLNAKQTENNQNDLHSGLIFLICWLGGKLESLQSLLRIYRVYPEFTIKKEFIQESTRRV